MDPNSVDDCFKTLRLDRLDDSGRDRFRTEVIHGLEYDQTYYQNLLDIKKKHVQTYVQDFFLVGDHLSQWWPKLSADECRIWLNNDRLALEEALKTLIEHWTEERRNAAGTTAPPEQTIRRPKATKSKGSPKRTTSVRTKAATHGRSNSYINGSPAAGNDMPVEPDSMHEQPQPTEVRLDRTPTTPQPTNSTLPDIPYNEESESDGLETLPTLTEIVANGSRWGQRRGSHTIEPQSPRIIGKGKQPERDPDPSYVVSQVSTIGQPPLSPPPTRNVAKRKPAYQINDMETDDESVVSPVPKRSRPRRNMLEIETNAPRAARAADAGERTDAELSQILTQMSYPLSDVAMDDQAAPQTPQDLPDVDRDAEHSPQPGPNNDYDAFTDLARTLHNYLRECKTNNVKQANDPQICKIDKEKRHIRAGVLEHLYCDVVSRIKAIDAKRKGLDRTDTITSYTLYA